MNASGKATTGVLLINLGTPDSPAVSDVRKYLREFLSDRRVIDVSALSRWLLVNFIIAPFRAPKSAKVYKEVWTAQGSPLLIYTRRSAEKLQALLGPDYAVDYAMRYQSPSIKSILEKFNNKGFKRLIIIPLYPQYASASTGSTHEEVMNVMKSWENIPDVKFVSNYPNHPGMIEAYASRGRKHMQEQQWDHILFSYHGLPERQIKKASCNNYCQLGKCCDTYHRNNHLCYRAQCFETSRHLAKSLGIGPEDYTVCFQSRLGKTPWVQPYTDDVLNIRAEKGDKKLLVFSPAFTADCLETIVEIGTEYHEAFRDKGGEKVQLVESLNDGDDWIEVLKDLTLNA